MDPKLEKRYRRLARLRSALLRTDPCDCTNDCDCHEHIDAALDEFEYALTALEIARARKLRQQEATSRERGV